MKPTKITVALSMCAILSAWSATSVHADHAQLGATQSQAVRPTPTGPAQAWALKFDLSSIPDSANIDAAELTVYLRVCDSSQKQIRLRVSPAPTLWSDIRLTNRGALDIIDSLGSSGTAQIEDSGKVSFDISQLAAIWHRGRLENAGLVITIRSECETGIRTAVGHSDLDARLSIFYSK